MWFIAITVMQRYAAQLGTEAYTAHQVILQILEMVSVIYQGIALANMSMIGSAYVFMLLILWFGI
ncbi:MAG TPA: hypothetical protein PLZ13_09380, partial [Ottowia sp.]|nr:hypothetical protein [Ottowia sp.]